MRDSCGDMRFATRGTDPRRAGTAAIIDIAPVRPPSAALMLRRTIRATRARRTVFCALRMRENQLRITREFCRFLTDLLPSRGGAETLAAQCLLRAVSQQRLACETGGDEDYVFEQFLAGLLRDVDEVLDWHVCVRREGVECAWDPMTEPLADFWARQGRKPAVFPQAAGRRLPRASDFRAFVAARILNRHDMAVLPHGLEPLLRPEGVAGRR